MHKRFVIALLAVSLVVCGLSVQNASGISPDIVINQVQTGPSGSASNEFIELYNNSSADVEITNWCLYYASATSTLKGNVLVCFAPTGSSDQLYLPAHSSLFAISNQLATAQPSLGYDFKFSSVLASTAGHIRLLTQGGVEVDKVGWGAAALAAEGASPAAVPTTSKVLQRKSSNAMTLQDTDNNSADFESALPRTSYLYGAIYEIQDLCSNIAGTQAQLPLGYSADVTRYCSPPPVDLCINIDGLQVAIPIGYALDATGDCRVDTCLNLEGLQLVLPEHYEYSQNGNCVEYDACMNIAGVQPTIPGGLKLDDDGRCILDLLPIRITELLANATGSDGGNEFIELYNPNDVAVDLTPYVLWTGITSPKSYPFPTGSQIGPGEYLVFSNANIAFTLLNSSSRASIRSLDDMLIDESPAYDSPKDDMSWANIGGIWQYTDRPTPGSANRATLPEVDEIEATAVSTLRPCAANQSRNPDTNRCRFLATASTSLVPCKDGQYRSEETNRCRSIASAVSTLAACQEDEERNPATNRCRQVAVAGASLASCKEGQERNPETNRCRTVIKIADAAYPVEAITIAPSGANSGWLAVGAVGAVAIGYAVWEWRHEIAQVPRKIRSYFHFRK